MIIVHSIWSTDVTKQGTLARCWTILSYPWFRNCSPIRDTQTYSRRCGIEEKRKRGNSHSPMVVWEWVRHHLSPPNSHLTTTLSVYVCMYACVCVCGEHKVLCQSCQIFVFVSQVFTWFIHSLYGSVKRLSTLPATWPQSLCILLARSPTYSQGHSDNYKHILYIPAMCVYMYNDCKTK